jgi:hypothetical protein
MTTATIALIVSCLSLVISGIALGWNIYKDVYLRARVRTLFRLMVLMAGNHREWRYCFSATNLGPGKVNLQALALVKWSIWRKLTRHLEHAVMLHDFKHPLGGKLPYDLDVGQGTQLTFNPDECKFLSENYTHIGLTDSFGRIHWCRRQDMKDAVKAYREKQWLNKNKSTERPV